jgi:hypothetical protein
MLNMFVYVVAAVAVGYIVAQFLFKKDTEIEDRRRGAARLAGVLSSLGLKKTPEFLIDYSVGDYSGMGNKVRRLAELFLSGPDAVVAEFEQVFDGVLAAKLKTEAGRAFVAAKLADAALASDPSVVTNAPAPAVTK